MTKDSMAGGWECAGCKEFMGVRSGVFLNRGWKRSKEGGFTHACKTGQTSRAVQIYTYDRVRAETPGDQEPEAGAPASVTTRAELEAEAMRLASRIQARLFELLAEWPCPDEETDPAGDACDLAEAYAHLMATVPREEK